MINIKNMEKLEKDKKFVLIEKTIINIIEKN